MTVKELKQKLDDIEDDSLEVIIETEDGIVVDVDIEEPEEIDEDSDKEDEEEDFSGCVKIIPAEYY